MSERFWIDGRAWAVPSHELTDWRDDSRTQDEPPGSDLTWRCHLCGAQDTVLEHHDGRMRCSDGEMCRQEQHDGGKPWPGMADQIDRDPDAPVVYGGTS